MDDDLLDLNVSTLFLPGKFFLQKVGLWYKTQNKLSTVKRVFRAIAIGNIIMLLILNLLNNILGSKKSLIERSYVILFLARQISVCQKIFIFMFRCPNITRLFGNATEKIQVPDSVKNSFDQYQQKCLKKPYFIFAIVVFSVVSGWLWITSIVVMSIFNATDLSAVLRGAIVIPVWLPFDLQNYPTVHKVIFGLQIIGLQPVLLVFIGFFAFYSCTLLFAVKMFDHLNEVVTILHEPLQIEPPFNYAAWVRDNQRVKEILKYAVQHHNRCLDFVDGINKIFAPVLLVEIWSILLIQCTLAFQLATLVQIPLYRQAALMQNITIMTIHLGVICLISSNVTDLAERASASLFATAWWTWDKSNQQSIRIMNIRSEQPVILKGGPVYSMALTTFLAIGEISFTYFMFLYQINDVE